jgi:hypothetical protein
MALETALQIAGWALTVTGQIQVALKDRRGFLTWIAANAVLIALSAVAGLWWSVGMFVTNVATCVWSYRRWSVQSSSRGQRRPIPSVGRAVPRWRAFVRQESLVSLRRPRSGSSAPGRPVADTDRVHACLAGSGRDPG